MAFKGLADFLEALSVRGELARVAVPVDSDLELAEITRRAAKAGGPALLFEHAGFGAVAVATNLLGTPARACLALGIDSLDELTERLEAALAQYTPQNWFDRLKLGGAESGLDKLRPRLVKQAACQQVVHLGRDVDLAAFPWGRESAQHGGVAITAGLCVTESREHSFRGVTRLRLMALDAHRLLALDDGVSTFAGHWQEHRVAGQPLPAAIVLGGDPALLPLVHLPLPPSVDMWQLAGILRGRPLEVIKCRTHGLEVPADAELVLEGFFTTSDGEENGAPLGSGEHLYPPGPIFNVAAITQRMRAILPVIVDSSPAGDGATLLKVRERALLSQLRTRNASIVDFSLPAMGGPHAFAVISLAGASAGLSRQVAAMAWASEPLRFTRFLAVVDAEVNVHDARQVLAAIGAHADPGRDVFSFDGPAHAADLVVVGGLARRLAVDATRKGSPLVAGLAAGAASEEAVRLVTARWAEYGLPFQPPAEHRPELPV